MTRKTAREIAVELCFASAANEIAVDELIDAFFEEEHYATLAEENELFSERPDDKQMAYICTLAVMSRERGEELDAAIERYAKGWKSERISRTARSCIWTRSPPPSPSTRRWNWIRTTTIRRRSPLSTACSAASCEASFPGRKHRSKEWTRRRSSPSANSTD